MVPPDDRHELLRIARTALREHFRSGRLPPGAPHGKSLLEPRAVFVTLRTGGAAGARDLRGCIGTIGASKPVYRAVQDAAIAAATRDPRFPPLTADELARVTIEISVLDEPLSVGAPDQIELGRHGVLVVRGDLRGVLLPQVAVEHGWSREVFLARACEKAGLPPDGWRDPETRVLVFEADVFDETSPA